ncbi:MAG: ArsB/NhaD family transporter [Nocardioidaceae bacterium]
MAAEITSLVLLATVLAAAVVRPHGLPEVFVAVPAAGIALITGIVSGADVHDETRRLLPIGLFLAAVLVLAQVCAAEGLFDAAGHALARYSKGFPRRLLTSVFVLSAAVTSVLSLDATVVLLTPVVFATAARVHSSPRPHVYAAGHLANSSSLLLPMGNLTNLLALAASGLTLAHFASLMLLPWLLVLTVEYAVFRLYFRADLVDPAEPVTPTDEVVAPRFAIGVLIVALVGFIVGSFFQVPPYWIAIAAALVLGVHALVHGLIRPVGLVKAIDLPFLLFVYGLAVVVRGVVDHGLGAWIDHVLPPSEGLVDLLLFAAIAAVLANLVNNLPALLILLTPAAAVGPVAVLAVLIGVNLGPNLSYPGSLATLLWRRVLAERGLSPDLRRFTTLGVLTVPAGIVLAVLALWAASSL